MDFVFGYAHGIFQLPTRTSSMVGRTRKPCWAATNLGLVWYDYQGTRGSDMGQGDSSDGAITSLQHGAPLSPKLQRIRIGEAVSFRMSSLIFHIAVDIVAVVGRSWKARDCRRDTFSGLDGWPHVQPAWVQAPASMRKGW